MELPVAEEKHGPSVNLGKPAPVVGHDDRDKSFVGDARADLVAFAVISGARMGVRLADELKAGIGDLAYDPRHRRRSDIEAAHSRPRLGSNCAEHNRRLAV